MDPKDLETRMREREVFACLKLLPGAWTVIRLDSRVWQAVSGREVAGCFRWRQEDSAHGALQSWCYWTLRKAGMDGDTARQALEGRGWAAQNELL